MARPAPVHLAPPRVLHPRPGASADRVLATGRAAGLDAVGLASAEPFDATHRNLVERRQRGLAGTMQFTYRNPARSTDPGRVVAGARALVVGALAYPGPWADSGVPDDHDDHGDRRGGGRVAAYARTDRYAPLRSALRRVADELHADGWRAVVVCDDNALVDRAAAHRAGLGWYGKNALFFVPGVGSRVLLGSVVTDAPILDDPDAAGRVQTLSPRAHGDGCGRCTRCLDACPTGALVAPGVVDARRCLAWLAQAPGSFPEEHRVALGARLYGCDECQRVCPVNRTADRRGVGDDVAVDEPAVDLLAALTATDEALLDRFGHWYVPRRDPTTIRRNVVLALGNTAHPADTRTRAALERVAAGDTPGDAGLLAEHARWSLTRIGSRA